MSIQGTLITKSFVNLLQRYALPAKAQLVITDALSGDILYPYDVSNYYGNAELDYVDINGVPIVASQINYTPIQNYIATTTWPTFGVNAKRRFEFSINQNIITATREDSAQSVQIHSEVNIDDATNGSWRLDWVQVDANNDPAGPPRIFNLNPSIAQGLLVISDFHVDSDTGEVSFLLEDHGMSFPADAGYEDPVTGVEAYLKLIWDFGILDRVRNLRPSGARANAFTKGLTDLLNR
jgi:hypothetical protein